MMKQTKTGIQRTKEKSKTRRTKKENYQQVKREKGVEREATCLITVVSHVLREQKF